jgi:putative membrane protein
MKTKRSAFHTMALFALFNPWLVFAQQTQQPPWNCPGPWHMWGGGWGFGWIFPMIMLFLIVLAVLSVVRMLGGGHHRWGPPWHMTDRAWGAHVWSDPTSSALQILNERFARGEIQKTEYEEKKATILSTRQR